MSTSHPNGPQRNGAPAPAPTPKSSSLESDIALLTQLLSADTAEDSDPESVAELLKRLEAAEGLADGVEERLDGIMDHLDSLLSDLEVERTAVAAEGKAVAVSEVKANEEGEGEDPASRVDTPK